jgi:hypothetical protein
MATESHEEGGNKLARRALLATAGVGACAAAAAATPWALGKAGELGQTAAKSAYEAGVEAGRQALLAELKQLENVALTDAISLAELARGAVNGVVVPVAKLVAKIGTGALDVIYNALGTAISTLGRFGQHVDWMSDMQDTVGQWRDNLGAGSTVLSSVLNSDISATEVYLRAVQAKIDGAKTPTPTTKPS